MAEDNTPPALDTTLNQEPDDATKLRILKGKADMLGITYSNNILPETLRQKINDHMEKQNNPPAPDAPNAFEHMAAKQQASTILAAQMTVEEAPKRQLTLREWQLQECMKLVRVRITNLDPKKKDLPGEILTVANEVIGTVRHFVPYGEQTDEGWHIPQVLYDFMKERKFLHVQVTKDRVTKQLTTTTRDVAEYSLEVLEPLSKEELSQLARAQMAAGSVD